MVSVMVSASIMAILAQSGATMMISQYRSQAKLELRGDANHALEIAALKIEDAEYPEEIGTCAMNYGDYQADLGAREVTATCRKTPTSSISANLTRLLECPPCDQAQREAEGEDPTAEEQTTDEPTDPIFS